jgi:hypothetical protein
MVVSLEQRLAKAVLRSLQEKERNGEKHDGKGWLVKLRNPKIGG